MVIEIAVIRKTGRWALSIVGWLALATALPAADPVPRGKQPPDRSVRPGLKAPSAAPRASNPASRPDAPAAETARNPIDELKHWIERNAAQRETNERQRDHASIRGAFRDIVADARRATVRVLADDMPVAYGTIVSDDGFVLTKASEIRGVLKCVLHDRTIVPAHSVVVKDEFDLALLKVDAKQSLTSIAWSEAAPDVGSFLATVAQDELPAAIGVVSLPPRRIAPAIGFLGVGLENERPRVIHIQPGSGADKAGLQIDDLVLSVNGERVRTREALQAQIRKHSPGQSIELAVRRGDHEFKVSAALGDAQAGLQSERADFQNRLGGTLSNRRAGFGLVLQHDSVIYPHECGGPLVDLDGKAVGVNIARAGRVASYAVPASVLAPLVAELVTEQRKLVAEPAGEAGGVAGTATSVETAPTNKAGGE